MKKLSISIFVVSMLCMISACKKEEPQNEQANIAQAAPAAAPDAVPTAKQDMPDSDALDPDGLYRDILDKRIPYPLQDNKAAKYEKSWKAGDDGSLDGYVYKDITIEFINDYKKRLEEAGFKNEAEAPQAPPLYVKDMNTENELRVHIDDTFCKDWVDDCDHGQKIGDMTIQIDKRSDPAPQPQPADKKQVSNAAEILAAYQNTADPQKLYAGMPGKDCIFPIRDGKPIAYGGKTDQLDEDAEKDTAIYTYMDIPDLAEILKKQLKEAGFKQNDDTTYQKGTCAITWDEGEGEFNLRMRLK